MLSTPVFKSHWVARDTGSGHLLFSEDDRYLLQGRIYDQLIPLLNGRNRVADIVKRLKGKVPAAEIWSALRFLESEGFLTESEGRRWTSVDAFWELAGSSPSDIQARLSMASVTVMASDTGVGESICRALSSLRIQVASGAPFRIVAVANYLDSTLEKLNQEALASGIPWVMGKPYGRGHWLGPLFVPGRTACWMCLAHRLQENGWDTAASVAALPTTTAATAAMLATEAAKWLLTGRNSAIDGQIRTINTATLEIETHIVHRRPGCPACGNPHIASSKRLRIGRARAVPDPDATVQLVSRHLSPITGIVSNLTKVCGDSGLFVYRAEQHQIARRDRSGAMILTRPLPVAGKGSTDAQARASCLAEAVERYSLQFHGDESRITASFLQLAGKAPDPRLLMQFSEEQYRRRKWWNARHSGFHNVPEPFQDHVPVEWVKAWSLTRNRLCYIPAAYCYLGYSESFCRANTNGCAAGNTLEEAILRGLLELVERDAVALWWYNRARRPAVDIESFQSREIAGMLKCFRSHKRSLHVLDITTDIGIPAFAAISAKPSGNGILLGTAAYLDATGAIVRALCELQQCLCTFGAQNRPGGDSANSMQRSVSRWMRNVFLSDQPWLSPVRNKSKTAGDYRQPATQDVQKALLACIQALERIGLEVLVLDMTRRDIAFPVARVIVPGLRHNWARLAPGRLYDTPVKLGWQRTPLKESEMNPIPYFL